MQAQRRRWMFVIVSAALVAIAIIGALTLRHSRGPRRSTTTLVVTVTAGPAGVPVGARILLFDGEGKAVHIGRKELYDDKRQAEASCPIAAGAVGTWDGIALAYGSAEIPIGADGCDPSPAIPYGRYTLWAWRGIEYELWKGEVDLRPGRGKVALAIPLERVWTPLGTLAADL